MGGQFLSFDRLMYPAMLALLALVAVVLVLEVMARPACRIRLSTTRVFSAISSQRPAWLRYGPPLMRALGLCLLVVALARPLQGLKPRRDMANVVDIMLCIDVSGSMRVMDLAPSGAKRSRLDMTKDAVRTFLADRKLGQRDRFGVDRIGIIAYAGYAWTQCPLTMDYGMVSRMLDLARIDDRDPQKQGTAIGSAIGLAVNKLRKSETVSQVVVLLTDGRHNRGELDPITASQFASEYGIRVYTIAAGAHDKVLVPSDTPAGRQVKPALLPVDEEMLRSIASSTGARFYRAPDAESLHGAYAEISQLEATEVETNDYYVYSEGFVPYAAAGLVLLLASVAARRMWFEAIP